MRNWLKNTLNTITTQSYIYLGACVLAFAVLYATLRLGFVVGGILSLVPILIYGMLYAIKNPYIAYIGLFVVNYFVIGISRYALSVQGGLVLDALILFNLGTLLIRSCYKDVGWKRAVNGLTFAALVWFLYCLMELMNPMASSIGWARSVRGIAMYFVAISILTPIIFYRFKDLKRILLILSILTLLAVSKALIQKYIGFDAAEMRWLYVGGGKTTHIIRTGIRYFSFYSDAANYGAGMGFAMVVFSITSLYIESKWLRVFYMFVACAAGYGMIISGTRSAFVIPMVGYALYIVISKNAKVFILGGLALVMIFGLLKYTYVGHSIAEVRRLRSVFNPKDESLMVRLDNQKLMAEYMKNRPFGSGIGMGGGKAKDYAPNAFLSQIPTDSWFVMVWVETGVVGLVLHISILLFILIYGCYVVVFKIKDCQLRGIISALNAGIFGIMVASYGNEIYGQLPTAIIIYMSEAFIFLSIRYDNEISENKQGELHEYEIEA